MAKRRQHIIAAINRMAIRRWGAILGEQFGPPRDWWDQHRPLGMPQARTVITRLGVAGWQEALAQAGLEPAPRGLSRAIPYDEDGLDPGRVDTLADINLNPARDEWPIQAIPTRRPRRVWDITSHRYVEVGEETVLVVR